MDKQSNLRLILAVAISFLVIVLWSKFFAPEDTKTKDSNTIKQEKNIESSEVPQSANNKIIEGGHNNMKGAPNADSSDVPSSVGVSKEILATIRAKDFDMDIDTNGAITHASFPQALFS